MLYFAYCLFAVGIVTSMLGWFYSRLYSIALLCGFGLMMMLARDIRIITNLLGDLIMLLARSKGMSV